MKSTNNIITLSEFAETTWKEYALYTLEERALPSMIDGLKPSQRFIIYSALKNAKDKKIKVVELAGSISSYGYHHGETSAQDAAVSMASTWSNNVPLLDGKGNFGSRMVQKASSPRYISAKLHTNFSNIFTDHHLAPAHADEDNKTPQYYLPIIPFVLLNGIQGTATGFGTKILPYDINDIIKLSKDHIKGKDISKKTILPKFPQFRGLVEPNLKGGYDLVGLHHMVGKTKLVIDELPYQYDREKYINVLNELEENSTIISYSDDCSKNGFKFTVTLPRSFDGNIEKIFKLRRSMTENLNVIDHNGKLREYENPINLIKDFCDIRIPYIQARIDTTITDIEYDMGLITAKIKFIKAVIDNKIVFKNKNKKDLTQHLLSMNFASNYIDPLLGMNFYHLTLEEIQKLSEKYESLTVKLDYFKTTTAETEYTIDLDKLAKEYKIK